MEAIDDVEELVEQITAYVKRHGADMGLTSKTIVAQICQFLVLRKRLRFCDISDPATQSVYPSDWTWREEEIWQEWLRFHFRIEGWQIAVIQPVFGTDVRRWEWQCDGWRDELFHMLPFWIARSGAIVEAFDPSQKDMDTDDNDSANKGDPYLIDHGSRKQKNGMLSYI